MGSRFVLSLGTLGLALATAVAPRAEAQTRVLLTVCRDGTRMNSDDSRVCDRRGGVDLRATAVARRDEQMRVQNNGRGDDRQNNGRGDDRQNNGDYRYGRNDRGNNGRWDNGRSNDPRYDPNNRNGGYNNAPRQVYQWQGLVDREIRIQLQGSHAYIQPMGGNEIRSGRGQMLSGLPQQEGTIRVERLEGRGDVDVIEQPSSSNGYRATLRVRDPRGGASNYRLVAYWQPAYSNGRYGRN